MSVLAIDSPLPTYIGLDGVPLSNGYVYFGVEDQDPRTNPVSVFWDEAMTIPAAQPVRTAGGYLYRHGAPARVWVDGGYSTMVFDSRMRQVLYCARMLRADAVLRADLSAPGGAARVGYDGISLQDVLDTVRPMQSYTPLRAYRGRATGVRITQRGIAGVFFLDPMDFTSLDNGGTVIVDDQGGRWKRRFESSSSICADWFEADWNGINSSSAAIIKAQDFAATGAGGGTVYFSIGGNYKVTTPVPVKPGVTYQGPMKANISAYNPGRARIFSSTGNVFVNGATPITEACFRDLYIESEIGGGHIFDWSSAGLVAKIEMSGVALAQRNKAKCVIYGVAAGGVFSIWLHDFEYVYVPDCLYPPIWIASTTVNSIVVEKFWSTSNGQSAAGSPSIWIESKNPGGHAFNVNIRNGLFEFPGGGSVRLLSCTNSAIEECTVYDLSITPGYYQFSVDQGGGPPSSNITLRECRSTVGTAAVPDLFLNMGVAGQGGFLLEGCTFEHVNGGTIGGGYVEVSNSALSNVANLAYMERNGGPEANLRFRHTGASSADVAFWSGYPGNRDGALNIKVNSAHAGSISKTGVFSWGNAYITPGGIINAGAQVYPGTPAGAQQVDSGLSAGVGAPNNANGNNGDVYFRGDGGAMTTIYQKRAGAWVAIL